MTRGGTRPIAALAAAVLAATLLAACGGSDSSTTGSTTSAESTSQAGGASAKQRGSSSKDHGSPTKKGGEGSGGGREGGGSGAVATPLHVSGGGSSQFHSKGGDNSVQNFGEESNESELQQAAEALHGFYVARAKEDWQRACSYMAKSMVQQLQQLAAQSPQLKGRGCAAVLKAFTRPLPSAVRRETTVVDAGSLRHEGEQAFLIYYGAEKTVYAMPMKKEGGTWKVGLLSATPLG